MSRWTVVNVLVLAFLLQTKSYAEVKYNPSDPTTFYGGVCGIAADVKSLSEKQDTKERVSSVMLEMLQNSAVEIELACKYLSNKDKDIGHTIVFKLQANHAGETLTKIVYEFVSRVTTPNKHDGITQSLALYAWRFQRVLNAYRDASP